MSFAVGTLVNVRGREWVVLPGTKEELVLVRPLGGTDDESTGILPSLEKITHAQLELPDPAEIGDYRSCKLLREALRIGFRSSAGPFRSFGKLAVEPRPYQIVPLLMALKLDPVRLLIADDVGIGKTIEAAMVARELLDRGEIKRIAVLCPPQLAEQWQNELRDKFNIDAELVLTNTAGRLERHCSLGESLFAHYPYVVVSTDFIKSDRRRDEFLRTCPEFVIVDEAHSCAYSSASNKGQHQRHQLVSGLSENSNRHMVFVTATPHSGKEDTFRSLLSFLNAKFSDLPDDLTGKENEHHRRELAQYFIQRQRGNIKQYLGENTRFPERELIDPDPTYTLSQAYRSFFYKVLAYARETVSDPSGMNFHQRVRWWSVLALLRSLASSPAAAAATLRNRAASADSETTEEADDLGKRTVLDLVNHDTSEVMDVVPGSDIGELAADEHKNRKRLLALAKEAETLLGENDYKLSGAIDIIKKMLGDGFNPIIFCRFIPTVEYLADELRKALPSSVEIAAITGNIPPSERESRIQELEKKNKKRVLVSTDALSEGINLQMYFNAVLHYDLSWNPTRHEQREGRVDRFGQPCDTVRIATYYGVDNQIDGIVLDVLIRKHQNIRNSLGISIPVPANSDQVIEAIFEGLLLRSKPEKSDQLLLPGFEEFMKPHKDELYRQYDDLFNREKISRSLFAQQTLKVDQVMRELQQARDSIGSKDDITRFVETGFKALGGFVEKNGHYSFDVSETPQALRDVIGVQQKFKAQFDQPVKEGVTYLNRTHPIVEGLATYLFDTAIEADENSIAKRCGVIRTRQVERRTTLFLTRFRFHILNKSTKEETVLLAEDASILAFRGSPGNAEWIEDDHIDQLLELQPDANTLPDQASNHLQQVIQEYENLKPHLEQAASEHSKQLLQSHIRVRSAAHLKGVKTYIEPVLPVDVLGIYIYLPIN
ncbi:MAG: helicase-related protein [candidate division KSB1 bacterium]|nr:helicase-related protein [candidate division KSB1 bacterium]